MNRHSLQPAELVSDPQGAALRHGAAAATFSAIQRWLAPRRRLPRLHLDELSAHRLRDLGFADGRGTPPRS